MAATTMMSMESALRDADVQSQSLSYMEKQLEFQQQQFGASARTQTEIVGNLVALGE